MTTVEIDFRVKIIIFCPTDPNLQTGFSSSRSHRAKSHFLLQSLFIVSLMDIVFHLALVVIRGELSVLIYDEKCEFYCSKMLSGWALSIPQTMISELAPLR